MTSHDRSDQATKLLENDVTKFNFRPPHLIMMPSDMTKSGGVNFVRKLKVKSADSYGKISAYEVHTFRGVSVVAIFCFVISFKVVNANQLLVVLYCIAFYAVLYCIKHNAI